MRSIIFALALAVFSLPSTLTSTLASALPDDITTLCQSPTVVSESSVGQNSDVNMVAYSCANVVANNSSVTSPRDLNHESSLVKRATSVCGATCTSCLSSCLAYMWLISHSSHLAGDTHCFNPAGGGPDPNDCKVISDVLRYDSQNTANTFNIPHSAAVVRMQYRSCYSFFVNQATTDLQYCRLDWVRGHVSRLLVFS